MSVAVATVRNALPVWFAFWCGRHSGIHSSTISIMDERPTSTGSPKRNLAIFASQQMPQVDLARSSRCNLQFSGAESLAQVRGFQSLRLRLETNSYTQLKLCCSQDTQNEFQVAVSIVDFP
jgi:hypothetical protein